MSGEEKRGFSSAEVEFIVKSTEGEETFRLKSPGALVIKKLLQLYTLGMIEAAELELTKVVFPGCERIRACKKSLSERD